MSSKVINLIILLFATGIAWGLKSYYGLADRSFLTIAWLAGLYLFFRFFVEELGLRKIDDQKSKYSFRKTIGILFLTAFMIVAVRIWIKDAQSLLVSYGIIAAGLAVALQDIFKNLAGGLIILIRNTYRVGDRVQIGEKYGDIVDIGILYTRLLEIREWLDYDQYTGRLTLVPNGFVIREPIENYTIDHNFIWDQIHVPIAYGSDWQKAEKLITEIAITATDDITKTATGQIKRMRLKYYIHKTEFTPKVFVKLTDNWISLSLYYPTPVRERASMHDNLNRRILIALERQKIRIASQTLELSGGLKVVR